MIKIPGGTLRMGSDAFYPDERPVHERTIAPFWIDETPVTNAEYARFVDETGYVTVAERPLDPALFPGVPAGELPAPGSMVFTPTAGPVDLRDWRQWWRWQEGASWRHPFGPDSDIGERMQHPVIHVAFEDATAYAAWAGKRLPTEAEHEYASRAGSTTEFAWGDEPYPQGTARANTWLGRFPHANEGVGGTSPVASYPANAFGLFDMIGNVWEWTTDLYTPRHVDPAAVAVDAGGRPNLFGAAPLADGRRVLKGGSHLCSPDYCLRFRPAARSPQSDDSATTHIGFRCVRDVTGP